MMEGEKEDAVRKEQQRKYTEKINKVLNELDGMSPMQVEEFLVSVKAKVNQFFILSAPKRDIKEA